MSGAPIIFVGFELTERLEKQLGECRERDRAFVEDPAYIEKVVYEGRRFIGKRIDSGAAHDRIEDTARSVVSLLERANPEIGLSISQAHLLGAEIPPDPASLDSVDL
ncbi:MAG: hypothetical protein R6V85_05035 [Polyangia bacterium]